MSKKNKKVEEETKEEKQVIKPKKKKMTRLEKNRIVMKIAGWIMAIVMLFGTLISILGMLIYYK
jgi:cell division protein FtsL